jgi:formylglycine-generating enzyme required for sulfatase activity
MGSDKDKDPLAYDDEIPQHEVTLPGYWIGKTPVTVAQFRAFVRESGYGWKYDGRQGGDDHPVVYVRWRDARAYCQWVSQRMGLRVTLPTEAQWEKAARGPDGRISIPGVIRGMRGGVIARKGVREERCLWGRILRG